MSNTTGKVTCWYCKRQMQSAGLSSHLRGHWRKGLITRRWIGSPVYGYWHYELNTINGDDRDDRNIKRT